MERHDLSLRTGYDVVFHEIFISATGHCTYVTDCFQTVIGFEDIGFLVTAV